MSASSTRRRLSLLTGSSLFAAALMAGVGGVALAPTAAFAANECGDPNTNTTANDVFTCTGTFAAITYPATNGNLTLNLQNNVTATTGGLVAVGTGTNSVSVGWLGDSPSNSGDPSLTSTSLTDAALQITRATAGGTISVSLPDNDTGGGGMVISGVSAGVRLSNMGTSSTTFAIAAVTERSTISASAGVGVELTTTGTGTLTFGNGSSSAPAGATITGTTAAVRMRTTGTGGGSLTNFGPLTASAGAAIDLGTTDTGNFTITNAGVVTGSTAAISIAGGSNATLTNNVTGFLEGALLFTNTGTTTITNNGRWDVAADNILRNVATATGSTTLNNSASGTIATNLDGAASAIDFGTGGATFSNAGRLIAGYGAEGAATLTLNGLAAWNNSGTVMFGANDLLFGTDGVANDRVVMSRVGGGTFTGSGSSLLIMDVDFAASQSDCSAAVIADCLDLRGQSTAGTSVVRVNTIGLGSNVDAHRIVLIDASGAGTDAGVFTLDPESTNYREVDGGLLDGGLFLYALEHDTAAKQYALEAVSLDGEAFELALISRQAGEPWRTATGMWHDRQADLRTSLGDDQGPAPGAWLKIAGGFIDENRIDALTIGADTLEFNTSYTQETTAVVGGVDLVSAVGEGRAWVLGVTAGKIQSAADFAAARSVVDLEGHSLGAYASFLAGPAFVDAIVNTTDLDLTHTGFGAEFTSSAKSFGYQLEAGYSLLQTGEGGAWVEPLAALTYVRTEVDDLVMGGATTSFEDAESLRGALGLRLGGDFVREALTTRFSATGRLWKAFEGETAAVFSAPFGDTDLMDESPETLGDLGVAISFFTLGGRLSANLAYNMLFEDDYQNTAASFGLRYNW